MNRWSGKVAVVTGASAGIGLATAKALLREGLIVVGLARRKEKMEKEMMNAKGQGKFYAKECDIKEEKNVIDAFEWIKQTLGTVHILINNAGVLKESTLLDAKTEDIKYVVDVNIMGLLHCTRQAVKLMKANGSEGHIVNIDSIYGHATPIFENLSINVYPATKYAVRSISESLIAELRQSKIRVCNFCPGLINTEIFEAGNLVVPDATPLLSSEDIAESIIHVIAVPAHVQITEIFVKPLNETITII